MGRRAASATPYTRTVAAIAVASCFAAHAALANPTGPAVVNGTAAIHQQGNLLQITSSPNAILNWQSFSIGANEITRFIQQSASSAVLNRVISQNPSTILGALQSNGRVFLINPNGMLFGAGAQVDVAGLVASTLNLSNADFLAGRLKFTEVPGAGSIVNQGNINAAQGGQVYLVGPSVTNSGVITTPKGEVILAAGNSVELVNPGTPNLRVEITAPDNHAVNLGQIVADAGRVGIYAGLINHSGTIRADSAQVTEDGRIILAATKSATLGAGSITTANGPNGGSITVQSGDTTLVSGTVEAKGSEGKGGTVQLLGNLVGLIDNASVNASGETGGGAVLVGGDFQGKNPDVQNAFRTYFGPNATIAADAITSGDGGKVIVWSDDLTRAYGSISARGGANSGNGGFVEVSGKNNLDFAARVDTSASNGATGTLLLDPRDINVWDTLGTNNSELNAGTPSGEPAGSILFADGGTADFAITDGAIESQTANIVLQAKRDITVHSGLSGGLTLTNAGQSLTLQAGRNINIQSPITTRGGNIVLEADSPHAPVVAGVTDGSNGADGIGLLTVGAIVKTTGGTPAATGGSITLIGGGSDRPLGGVDMDANVIAGTGGIHIAFTQSTAQLGFFIGDRGQAQLSSYDTGYLQTTGPLVLGQATTAGSDGVGTGAQTLTVNSITNQTANPMQLSAASGSSFTLIAGDGGITLQRPLFTFQPTFIQTTGTLSGDQTIGTSNQNLTLNVGTFAYTGSINTGTGTFTCNGTGCPGSSAIVLWDGGAGTLNWFDGANWSGPNLVPTASQDVTIGSGFGEILINGTAAAKSLIAGSPLKLSSGSLSVTNASSFSDAFTLSGGTLNGTGSMTVGGTNGILSWSGGTMSSGGNFYLSGSGTLSGPLTLNRLFNNTGTLTLSGATLNGTGSIANGALITVANGTSNVVNTLLSNAFDTSLGTIQVNGSLTAVNFPTNSGIINIASGATLSTNNASLANGATGAIQISAGGTLNLGSGSFNNSGSATFDGVYSVPTNNVSAGTVTFNGTASTGTLALSGGTVVGTGSLTVTTDFNQTGGSLGTTFTDLALTKSGNFNVGGFTATHSVRLTSTGAITLNGAVSAAGTGDAVVLAGTGFTNNVGASALSAPNGRWLVYSTNPSTVGESRGGLFYDFKQYNATYGVTPVASASGKGFLYSVAPTITPRLTGTTSKVYDGTTTASLAPANYATTGAIDGDTVTLNNPATGAFANKNVGTGKSVSATVALASATDGSATVYGYQLASTTASGNIGDVTARSVGITNVTANNKVYDANTTATLNTGTAALAGQSGSTGYIAGDVVALSSAAATGSFNTKDAGTAKPVTAAGFAISGTDAANYTLAQPTGLTANITAAALVVTANNAGKSYDGLAFSGGNGVSYSGFVSGETAAVLGGAVSYGGSSQGAVNAGSYTITPAGLASGNYNISFANGTLMVDPARLNLSGNRTYDGSTNLAASTFGTINGVAGETLTVSGAATVASKNVGTQALTGVPTLANGTGLASNYTLTGGTHTGTITKAALALNAVSDTKVYDGTTSSTGTPTTVGLVGGDAVGSLSQAFTSKNVLGTNGSTLGVSGGYVVNDGNSGGNYTVTTNTATGTITPAALLVSGVTASNKVYDATTAAALNTGSASVTPLGGDVVALSSAAATGSFNTKDVGTAKPVTAAGFAIGGADAANYTLAQPTGLTANITPAALAYLANAASRERGDPNPVFGGAVSGFVGGETLTTATTGTPSFTSPATQSSVEGRYSINGSGLTALNGNYTFMQAPANTTALTVTAPVNFSWTSNTGGAWESGSNWNKGFAPVAGAVVAIPDLPGSATITYSSGTTSVKMLTSFEGLTIAGGTLNLGASAADVSTFYLGAPLTLTGGKLGGAGTIIGNVNNVAGTVAPGMSAGVLTINGNYMQGSGGTLAVELGGTAAGTQYDQLVVTGNSTLGGTLSATLVNGFVPASGEAFTIVQSGGTVNGTFAATNLPSTPSFSTNYLVSSVNVTTGGALVPPLAVVETTTQAVMAASDQSITSPATKAPPPDEKKDKESGAKKKPVCTGGSSGGGGGGVAVSGGGGRCTTRGCT